MDTAGRFSAEAWTAKVISAIGTDSFEDGLNQYLSSICRVDFCACYSVRADSVVSSSSSDPARFGSAARITLNGLIGFLTENSCAGADCTLWVSPQCYGEKK